MHTAAASDPGNSNHPPPPPPSHNGQVPDDPLAQLFKDLIPGDIYEDNGAHSFWQLIFPQGDFNPPPAPPGTTVLDQIELIFNNMVVGSSYLPDYQAAANNPAQLLAVTLLLGVQLITHRIADVIQLVQLPAVSSFLGAATPAAGGTALGGFTGLSGLAGLAPPVPATAPLIPVAPPPQPAAVPAGLAGAPLPRPTAGPALSAPPASVPPPSPLPPPPPAPPPPIMAPTAPAFPWMVGGPSIGSGSSMSSSAGARKTAPKADTVSAPAAAAATRETRRARRRRRTQVLGYGDEYMDMNIQVEPDWGAAAGTSHRGAGTLGFAGAAPTAAAAHAAGLTTLAGDSFGGGPTVPMVPGSWENPADGPDLPA
jgi:PPE-repeat protein